MFIPTYRSMPRDTLYKLQNRLARNLKLKDYFRDRDQEDQSPLPEKFVLPKTWTPPDSKVSPTTLEIIQDIFCSTEGMIQPLSSGDRISLPNTGDNLTKAEREALAALRDRSDIIIKPADKGSATVVMDTQAYLQEAYRQLNNDRYYRRLPSLLLPKNCETINGILSDMLQAKAISEDQFSYLKKKEWGIRPTGPVFLQFFQRSPLHHRNSNKLQIQSSYLSYYLHKMPYAICWGNFTATSRTSNGPSVFHSSTETHASRPPLQPSWTYSPPLVTPRHRTTTEPLDKENQRTRVADTPANSTSTWLQPPKQVNC
jgi:hypothetical protein